jgi:hydrogenase maturation protease
MHEPVKPILIFTWGNPSRGDDAIGPQIYDLLRKENFSNVDLLTDFQLQIEHAVDLENRARVLFIDASVSAAEPYQFYRLQPARDDSFTTHAMSPESLLATFDKVNSEAPPPAYMLSIRGYDFDLGLPISDRAIVNIADALVFTRQLVTECLTEDWDKLTRT